MAIELIDEILAGFAADPADSDYQTGYRQALIDLRQRLVEASN